MVASVCSLAPMSAARSTTWSRSISVRSNCRTSWAKERPGRIYLQKDGRTVKTLLVPAAAIADFLDRISIAHRR
jgi:hypothetical protein